MHQRDGARDLDQPQEESVAVIAEEERPESDLFSAPAHENGSKTHQASERNHTAKSKGQRKCWYRACECSVQRIHNANKRTY